MDKQQHIQNLKNNIASWETNAESLRQSILSKPNQMLQSKLDGILAGIERDKAELEVLESAPEVDKKEVLKEEIKQQIIDQKIREEAEQEAKQELIAMGVLEAPQEGPSNVADNPPKPQKTLEQIFAQAKINQIQQKQAQSKIEELTKDDDPETAIEKLTQLIETGEISKAEAEK